MGELSVKKLDYSDLDFLYRLLTDGEVSRKLHWRPASMEALQADYHRYWENDPDEKSFILQLSGRPVGWLKLNGYEGDTLWVSMLVIAPAFSGQGYARQALRFSETQAAACGKRKLRIQTTVDNLRAIALYIRHGFTLEQHEPDDGRFVFGKELSRG
ncbi:MAG: GNAT family N-acetyltransferase [Oscillospiraceae bacterium]